MRAWSELRGVGVKVGVISDGVDSMSDSQFLDDLPAKVEIDPELPGEGDEGTALLEIVHDLAPGASLAFSGPIGSLEMVEAIDWLANDAFGGAGADIIVDDLGFYREPYFEDGAVALAAADAVAGGAVFVSAGGNQARRHYEAEFVDGGDGFHAFAPNDTAMGIATGFVRVSPRSVRGRVTAILQWSDRWGAAGTDYDLFVCVGGGGGDGSPRSSIFRTAGERAALEFGTATIVPTSARSSTSRRDRPLTSTSIDTRPAPRPGSSCL